MSGGRAKAGRAEADILNGCLLALSQAGCLAFRNNTGALQDKTGRLIRYGLHVGSSDIIGLAPDGVFIAVECKSQIGRTTEAQDRFIAAVIAKGGRAGVARNEDDALKIALGAPQLRRI